MRKYFCLLLFAIMLLAVPGGALAAEANTLFLDSVAACDGGREESELVEFTAPADGYLTLTVSGDPGYRFHYGVNGGDESIAHTGTEGAYTYPAWSGDIFTFRFWCYDAENWTEAEGTVQYTLTFREAELPEPEREQAAYVIAAEQTITEAGAYSITMAENAAVTIVPVTPESPGIYTIRTENARIGNYGAFTQWILESSTVSHTTELEWTCHEAGQSLMLGILSDGAAAEITVVKTGEYVKQEAELQTYRNKAELKRFSLPADALVGDYVDVYGETHRAVLGPDGYYHLDSADGDILLVDLNYICKLSEALEEGRRVMHACVLDETGAVKEKWDIGPAIQEYERVCNWKGYYPLTEDLKFFYEVYAAGSGVCDYYLEEGFNRECGWMFACLTVRLPAQPPQLRAENIPSTGKIKLTWTAVEGAAGYSVSIFDENGELLRTVNTKSNALRHVSAEPGKVYSYIVRALDAEGAPMTADSEPVRHRCVLARPKVRISNLPTSGKIRLTWERVEGAAGYEVYCSADKNGAFHLLKTVRGTSLNHISAEPGRTYYYYVVAKGAEADSARSSLKYRCCDCARPEVSVSRNDHGKPVLTWGAVAGAARYRVSIHSPAGALLKTVTVRGCRLTHGSAVAGTGYFYRVTALGKTALSDSAPSLAAADK